MEIPIHVEWIRNFLKDKIQSFNLNTFNSKSITPQVYAILCQYRTFLNSTNMAPYCNHYLYSLSLYVINQNYDFENSSFQRIQIYLQNVIDPIDLSVANLENSSSPYFDEYDKLASLIMHFYLISTVLPSTISPGIFCNTLDSYEEAFEKWVQNSIGDNHSFFQADFLFDVTSAQSISVILAKIRPELIRMDQITFGPSISKNEIQKNWHAIEFALMALGIRRLENSDRLCVLCFLANLFIIVSAKHPDVPRPLNPISMIDYLHKDSADSMSYYSRIQKLDMLLDKVNELAYRQEIPKEKKKEPVLFKPVNIISSIMQPPIKSSMNKDDQKKPENEKPTIIATDNFENELQIIRQTAPKKKKDDNSKLHSSFLDSDNDSFIDAKNIPQRIIKQNAIKRKSVKSNISANKKIKDPKEESISYSEQRSLFKDLEQIMKNQSEQKAPQIVQPENKKSKPAKAIIHNERPRKEDELYSQYQISKQLKEERQRIISKKKQAPHAEIEEDNNIRKKKHSRDTDSDFEYEETSVSIQNQKPANKKKEKDFEPRRIKNTMNQKFLVKKNNKKIQNQQIEHEEEESDDDSITNDDHQILKSSSSSSASPSPKKNDKGSYYNNYLKRKELIQKANLNTKTSNEKPIENKKERINKSHQSSFEFDNENIQLNKKNRPKKHAQIEPQNEDASIANKKKKHNQGNIEHDDDLGNKNEKQQARVNIHINNQDLEQNKVEQSNQNKNKRNIIQSRYNDGNEKKRRIENNATSPKRSKLPLKVKTPKKSTLNEMLNDKEAEEIQQKHQIYKNMVTNLDDSNDLQFSNNSNLIPYPESNTCKSNNGNEKGNNKFTPLLDSASHMQSNNSKASSFFSQKEEIDNEENSKSGTFNQATRSSIRSFLEIERITLNQQSSSSLKKSSNNDNYNSSYIEEEIDDETSSFRNDENQNSNDVYTKSENEYEESNLSQIPSDVENGSFSQNEQSSIISENRDDDNDTIKTLEILSNPKSGLNSKATKSINKRNGNLSNNSSINKEKSEVSAISPNLSSNKGRSKISTIAANSSTNKDRSQVSTTSPNSSIYKDRSKISAESPNSSMNKNRSQVSTASTNSSMNKERSKISAVSPNSSINKERSKVSAVSPNHSILNSSKSNRNKSEIIDQLNRFDDFLPGFDDSDDFQDPLLAFGSNINQISSSDILNKLSNSPNDSDRKLLSLSIEDEENEKHQSNKLNSNDHDYPSFSIEEDQNEASNQPIEKIQNAEHDNNYSNSYTYSYSYSQSESQEGESRKDSIKSDKSMNDSNENGNEDKISQPKPEKTDQIIRFSNEDDEDALPSLLDSVKDSSSDNNEEQKEKSNNYTKSNYYYSSQVYSDSIEEEEEDKSDIKEYSYYYSKTQSYASDEQPKGTENHSNTDEKTANEIASINLNNTSDKAEIKTNPENTSINNNTATDSIIEGMNEKSRQKSQTNDDSTNASEITQTKDETEITNKTEIIDFSLYDSFDQTENIQNNDGHLNKTNDATLVNSLNKTENGQGSMQSHSQSNSQIDAKLTTSPKVDDKDQLENVNDDLNKEKIKSSDVYSESLLGLSISSSGISNSDFLKDPKSPTVILTEAPITDLKTLPITKLSGLHEQQVIKPQSATTAPLNAPDILDSQNESDLLLSINQENSALQSDNNNILTDMPNLKNETLNDYKPHLKLSASHNSITLSNNSTNANKSINDSHSVTASQTPINNLHVSCNSMPQNNTFPNTVSHANYAPSNTKTMPSKNQNNSIQSDALELSQNSTKNNLNNSQQKDNMSMSVNSNQSTNKTTSKEQLSLMHSSNQSKQPSNDGSFDIIADNTLDISLIDNSKAQTSTDFLNDGLSIHIDDEQSITSINNFSNTEPGPSQNTYSDSIPFKVLNDDPKESALNTSEKSNNKSNTYHITPISSNLLNDKSDVLNENDQQPQECNSLRTQTSPVIKADNAQSKLAKTYNADNIEHESSITPIDYGDEFLLHQHSLFDLSPVKTPTKEMGTLTKIDTSLHDENERSEIESNENQLKKPALSIVKDNSNESLSFSADDNSPNGDHHSLLFGDKNNSSEMNSSDRDELFNSVMTIPSESLSSYSKRSTETNGTIKPEKDNNQSELDDLTLSINQFQSTNEQSESNNNSRNPELSIFQSKSEEKKSKSNTVDDFSILDTTKLTKFDSDSDEGNIQITGEVVIPDDDEKEVKVELPSNKIIKKNHSKTISGSLEFTDEVINGLDSVKNLSEIEKNQINGDTKQSTMTMNFTNDVKQGLDSLNSMSSEQLTVSSKLDFTDDVKKGIDSFTIDSTSNPINISSPIDFTDDVKNGLDSSQLVNDIRSDKVPPLNSTKTNESTITNPINVGTNNPESNLQPISIEAKQTNTSTAVTSGLVPPKFIDSSKIEMISSPIFINAPETLPEKPSVANQPIPLDCSISKLPSTNTSLRVTFDPSVIRMSQKDEKRMIHNQQFQPILVATTAKEQTPPKPLTDEEKAIIHRYVHEAHEVNKSKYQYLSGLEEKTLIRVLPRASEMSQAEIYDAISNDLQIPRNDPITHKIVSNLNVFLGRSNEKMDLMSKTSSVKIPDVIIEEEESDDEYF